MKTIQSCLIFSRKYSSRHEGYAMVLAISVLTLITLGIAVVERYQEQSMVNSHYNLNRVKADYACHGAAITASVNPPDSFSYYPYASIPVEVSVHNPPLSLIDIVMHPKKSEDAPPSGSLFMLCAAAAAPTGDSTVESTWYYLVNRTDRPEIWTSWPGIERLQPY